MARALVIYAHPCQESFSAALNAATIAGLETGGWEVDRCDLYAEGFDPVLGTSERRQYHDLATNCAFVQAYVDRLRAADALILVFPVWNFGFPAILKGFLDRVFLPGVSFRLEDGRVRPNLTHIQRLAAVTTYGGNRARAVMAGDPPRKCVRRAIWHVTRPGRLEYLALYDMNRASEEKRGQFLKRVGRTMETF